ncbi:hypothetical protein IFR05_011449 [Cadophora sp. M221]|nr:hypothetical protein IFR05_011449 [Cadophora sp. M221]
MVNLAKQPDPPDENSDRGRLFRYIFKDNLPSSYEFIRETMNAIVLQPVSKIEANTFIYCDGDKRWQQGVTGVRGLKPSNWYDSENKMVYNTISSITGLQATPGCLPGASGNPRSSAAGETYCNSHAGGGRCTITLCDLGIGLEKQTVSQLPLAKLGSMPVENEIDMFSMLSTTLLHEIAHTIEHENSNTGRWKDVGLAYRWQNVVSMTSPAAAQANAENFAYWGLGNLLLSHQTSIGKNGAIWPEGRVPFDQQKRRLFVA